MWGVVVEVVVLCAINIRMERVDGLFCQLCVPVVVEEGVEAMILSLVPSLGTLGPSLVLCPCR